MANVCTFDVSLSVCVCVLVCVSMIFFERVLEMRCAAYLIACSFAIYIDRLSIKIITKSAFVETLPHALLRFKQIYIHTYTTYR